jgi:hypothetical protein
VSATAISLTSPGKASGSASIQDHAGSGQFDIQAGPSFSVASGTATKYQYRLNGTNGTWADVAAGQWLTSAADTSVYGTTVTVEYRGCRDASDGYCGLPSTAISLVPVNTRAAINSCVIGAVPSSTTPVNAGTPVVRWLYSYNDGGLLSAWSPFAENAQAPQPSALGSGTTSVRVKALVEIGPSPYYTDPGYGEGTCTP